MNNQQRISDLFDDVILGLLRNGREVIDEDGVTQRVPLTAADLNIIRQRLRDCGMTAIATDDNPIGNIVRELKARGANFSPEIPEVSQNDDIATRVG
jgi:hypothetical protein